MPIPIVIFAWVHVPEGAAEENLATEVERAMAAVRASVGVVGWEIVREGA